MIILFIVNWKYPAISLALIVIGVCSSQDGMRESRTTSLLKASGESTFGKIVDAKKQRSGRRRSRSTSYHVMVAFPVENGQHVEKAFEVGSKYFNRHVIGGHISKPDVKVFFRPGDAYETAELSNPWVFPPWTPGVSVGLLGMCGIFLTMKGHVDERRDRQRSSASSTSSTSAISFQS